MKKCRLVIFSLISIVLIMVGLFFWFSEFASEQRSQDYIETLEKLGCIIEEYPFSDSHVTGQLKINYFSDFRSIAMQEEVVQIYCDRGINALYFFHRIQDMKVEIVVFYY